MAKGGGIASKLGDEILRTFDRACHQLGKERDIQSERQRVFTDFGAVSVHIDGVRHGLKRIEADAHGQDDLQGGDIGVKSDGMQGGHDRVDEKIIVFEKPQDAEVGDDTEQEKAASLVFGGNAHPITDHEVDHGGQHEQSKEAPIPGAVEIVACGKQKEASKGGSSDEQPANDEDGEEEPRKLKRVEKHWAAVYPVRRARLKQLCQFLGEIALSTGDCWVRVKGGVGFTIPAEALCAMEA